MNRHKITTAENWEGKKVKGSEVRHGSKIQLCKNDKSKIKAYQCELCEHFDVDDLSDETFCHRGFWPGCGDPDGCREAFEPVKGRGIIGAHL